MSAAPAGAAMPTAQSQEDRYAAGTLTLDVPKTAGAHKPFFPQSLERGRRSCRAVMLALAEMYVKGVSTRAVEKVLAEFGIEGPVLDPGQPRRGHAR